MLKVITLPEGGRGVRILMAFLFCAYKAVHLKEQPYLHPDGDLVGITFTPPTLIQIWESYVKGIID